MPQVKFKLPFPPTVGNYWIQRVVQAKGRKPFVGMSVGKKGKKFRQDVHALMLEHFGNYKPLTERVAVRVLAVMPDRRKRDLDNLSKATFDALTHAKVWDDDEQIDYFSFRRGHIEKPGWLEVTISTIPETLDR